MRWRAPAKVTSHIFEGRNPMYTPIPSEILPVEEDGDFIAQIQIKITNGYRREAIEKYKHVATYVAIFPVLGGASDEERHRAPG